MKEQAVGEALKQAVVQELSKSPLFETLSQDDLGKLALSARLVQCGHGDVVARQGDPADSFFLVVDGEVRIEQTVTPGGDTMEVARVKPFESIGELGVITNKPRMASIVVEQGAALLKFDRAFFERMFATLPAFGMSICRVLGERLSRSSRSMVPLTTDVRPSADVDPAALSLLPLEFVQRHRVLPMKVDGNVLHLGFVDDPRPEIIASVRDLLPGMSIRPEFINMDIFNNALRSHVGGDWKPAGGAAPAAAPAAPATARESRAPKLDQLLRHMVTERASDLHLSARHQPRWRIDGSIDTIPNLPELGAEEVFSLIEPVMPQRNIDQFKADNDTDFAYAIPGVARFRVNLFRDNRGAGAVFRQIPDKILTIQQLGLPEAVVQLCDQPKGLIVVTGPTGSGKSTTLAAMIDHINNTREDHIITMEDPVEFVHPSKKCLVNQREVGPHTQSFARALRAALREDPDIVLVGEMRDLETVALALETANTGHLVFGTLHTNTAISTINRIVDMFPAGQQNQIRTVLADSLKGVVAQTLCKRIGGGRIAALEVLVSDVGVASLLREGKTQQLMSAMQTGKSRGNRILNEELTRMVGEKIVDPQEALSKAVDKPDLIKRLEAINAIPKSVAAAAAANT